MNFRIANDLLSSAELWMKNNTSFIPKDENINKKLTEGNSNQYYIFISWIAMWSATLWHNETKENNFRFMQLLDVLDIIKRKNLILPAESYQVIMQSCINVDLPLCALQIYNSIPVIKYRSYGTIMNLLFKAIELANITKIKNQEKPMSGKFKLETTFNKFSLKIDNISEESEDHKSVGIRETNSSLDPNSKLYSNQAKAFRDRSFLLPKQFFILSDEVKISYKNSCDNCGAFIRYSEIIKLMRDSDVSIECKTCKNPMIPEFTATIGRKFNNANLDSNTITTEKGILMNPLEFQMRVEDFALKASDVLKINPSILRIYYKQIFWNSIIYFSENLLPYDFILPYKYKIKEENCKKIFQQIRVNFCSKLSNK